MNEIKKSTTKIRLCFTASATQIVETEGRWYLHAIAAWTQAPVVATLASFATENEAIMFQACVNNSETVESNGVQILAMHKANLTDKRGDKTP